MWCDVGPAYYHMSKWVLYEFNLPQISLYDKYSMPYIEWEIEKYLTKEQEN